MRKAQHGGATQYPHRDHYAEVTDQVIAALEAGTPPWRKPWDPDKAGGPAMPCNATTGARYRGVNVLTLAMSPLAFMTADPRWATYKQAQANGWQVKKGSRSTTAFFFKRIEVEGSGGDSDETTRRIPMLRAFSLFHASQIEGIGDYAPPSIEEAPWRAPEATETIVRNSGAVLRIGGERAFYSPMTDHIQMPPQSAFRSSGGWSSVILHEMSHWSGSATRLNRDLKNKFGSTDYAREELRAELAQSFICSEIGIEDCDFQNSASYLAEWLERLRSDRKEIFRAAADAERIAEYLLRFHPGYAKRPGERPAVETDVGEDATESMSRAQAA